MSLPPWNVFNLTEDPPGGTVPLVFFGMCLALLIAGLLGALLMVVAKYRHAVVKSRQPIQVIISFIACIAWYIGYAHSVSVLPQSRHLCIAFNVWVQQVGLSLFVSFVLSRQVFLFVVFHFPAVLRFFKRNKISPQMLQLLQVVLNMPMFIYCIVATIVEWNRYRDEEGRCRFTKEGVFVAHGIVVPYIFMTFAMALLTMRIRKEFREIRIYIGLSFLMVVASSLIFLLWSLQLIRLRGVRIVMMMCPFVMGLYFLISTLGECILRFFLCQHKWFGGWIDKFHANTQRQFRDSLLSHRRNAFNNDDDDHNDNGENDDVDPEQIEEQIYYVPPPPLSQEKDDSVSTARLANSEEVSLLADNHGPVESRADDSDAHSSDPHISSIDHQQQSV